MINRKVINIPVKQTTVNMITGKETEKEVNFGLMRCAPDKCPECAIAHDPKMPHDAQSLYYQYKFYGENDKRWPTWLDAMAHCTEEMQTHWKRELLKMGVKLS